MNDIIECTNKNEFVKKICEIIFEQANLAIKKKDSFTFVLSGGKTPKSIFEELVLNYQESIEWSKVHFFWLDERCVSSTHDDSNYKLAYDYLVSKLNDIGSVHRIKGELEPSQAAKDYKQKILSFFRDKELIFDFILLGMGEDGHVASLFPDTDEINKSSEIVLHTKDKHNGYYRISLGIDLINSSKNNLLIINNKQKKMIYYEKKLNLPIHIVKVNQVIILGE